MALFAISKAFQSSSQEAGKSSVVCDCINIMGKSVIISSSDIMSYYSDKLNCLTTIGNLLMLSVK